jgi:hypothetical protein
LPRDGQVGEGVIPALDASRYVISPPFFSSQKIMVLWQSAKRWFAPSLASLACMIAADTPTKPEPRSAGFAGHAGATGILKLTFEVDHSAGANQSWSTTRSCAHMDGRPRSCADTKRAIATEPLSALAGGSQKQGYVT